MDISIANVSKCSPDRILKRDPTYWSRRRAWWRLESARRGNRLARHFPKHEDSGGLPRLLGVRMTAHPNNFRRQRCSASELQFHYEQALRRRDRDRLPKATLGAIDFLIGQNDAARLEKFLEGRPKAEVEKIVAYIGRKAP